MKIDLTKNGLDAAFLPWEVKAIQLLTERPPQEYTSGTLHKDLLESGVKISQASVTYLLEGLANYGILNKRVAAGKGGKYGFYAPLFSYGGVLCFVADMAQAWVEEMYNLSSKPIIGEVKNA